MYINQKGGNENMINIGNVNVIGVFTILFLLLFCYQKERNKMMINIGNVTGIFVVLFFLVFYCLLVTEYAKPNIRPNIASICKGLLILNALFLISTIAININCRINGNEKETLLYNIDSSISNSLEIRDAGNDTIFRIKDMSITVQDENKHTERIDIDEIVSTTDKSKAGIYRVKQYCGCFYRNSGTRAYIYKSE